MPKWTKGSVCKTVIRRFESARHLQISASHKNSGTLSLPKGEGRGWFVPRGEGWVLATLASAQIPDNPPLTILTTLSLPNGEGRGWFVPRGEGWVLVTLASAQIPDNPPLQSWPPSLFPKERGVKARAPG